MYSLSETLYTYKADGFQTSTEWKPTIELQIRF